MKKIMSWLAKTEDRALKLYEGAAEYFRDDKELNDFLIKLAREERMHYEFLKRASESAKDIEATPSITFLSNSTIERIDSYFSLCERKLESKLLKREGMYDFIVSTEFSEWNTLFYYVINYIRLKHPDFIPDIRKIYRHKKDIEAHLSSRPGTAELIERMKDFPVIWEEKILVVDDEELLTASIQAILEDEGAVDTASNGLEGLKKVSEGYYSAIFTDIKMPVMNGIEFYKRAVEMKPEIKDRFIFFTGAVDKDHISFLRENNLKYLLKPADLGRIKDAVLEVLTRTEQ